MCTTQGPCVLFCGHCSWCWCVLSLLSTNLHIQSGCCSWYAKPCVWSLISLSVKPSIWFSNLESSFSVLHYWYIAYDFLLLLHFNHLSLFSIYFFSLLFLSLHSALLNHIVVVRCIYTRPLLSVSSIASVVTSLLCTLPVVRISLSRTPF